MKILSVQRGINQNTKKQSLPQRQVSFGAILPSSKVMTNVLGGFLFSAACILPVQVGLGSKVENKDKIEITSKKEKHLGITNDDLKGLKIVEVKNFAGGKILKYTKASVETLRSKIIQPSESVAYDLPIENSKQVYLHELGMFGAPRTGGRPHQGLDIYVTPNGVKPIKPVVIKSPIDGVVVSRKNANPNDNVVSNMVTILGVDGNKYSFDHMARKEDYPKYKNIKIPDVGTIIKKGDSLGYVGRTGETIFWHLHLIIMTKNGLKEQLADPKWIELSKKSKYTTLLGQVNPLDEKAAGEIAKLLKKYARR